MNKIYYFLIATLLTLINTGSSMALEFNSEFYKQPEGQITIATILFVIFLLLPKKMKTVMLGATFALGMIYLLFRLAQAWQGL